MKQILLYQIAGIAMVAVGCTMAPKYVRPAAPVSAEWPSGDAYAARPESSNELALASLNWEAYFSDANLQSLIRSALTNNRDLRLAIQNVQRARAMYGIQQAELLPQVNALGGGSVQRSPADLSSTGRRHTSERYDVSLGVASWEIDFFGRIRSLKDRALQEYLASEQARRAAEILLISSVAQAYLEVGAKQEDLALAKTTLESQTATYKMIQKRYELGLVPELDLHRVRTQVESAREEVARYTQAAAQAENALTLLLGGPVPKDLIPSALDSIQGPAEVAVGLPSEVLLRRPDVLEAENMLRAANADIGAARAAFFPRISLTAAIGTASSDLSGLFKSGSGAWSYAPQIVMPIFDARTWAAHRAAKVQREMAVTQYEGSIQAAFREVADVLAVRGTMEEQVSAQKALVHATAETYRLSRSRYEKGIDSYLSVLDSQQSLFVAQRILVELRLAKRVNQARLYAVLGGGQQSQ
jgi:multidrug efflux system outer membrane protein